MLAMPRRPTAFACLTIAFVLAASILLLPTPSPVRAETAGIIYVVDNSCCGGGRGGVIRVDPSQPNGSNQTVVSSGQSFASPFGIAVVPGVSIADAATVEGSTASFTVTLDPWSVLSIVVPYSTANGTASAGSDYVATNSAVTFNPGQISTTATVAGLGDTLDEPAETFSVTLQPPNGVGAVDGAASATIADDDPTATLAVFDASVVEGNSGTVTAVFAVTLSPPAGQAVTIDYATGNGSAQAGTDFQAANGTLTFQPGETSKSISVTVTGDATYEQNETFTLTLSNPTGGAANGRAQATGTISNDDPLLACTPRPRVVQTPVAGAGQLQVHVESTPLNSQQNNLLQELRFGNLDNATVTMNGQPVAAGQVVTLSQNTVGADFTVRRLAAGQPTTVHLTIVDGCGSWKTFVGGGEKAAF
jgi:hypothetical protein